MSIHAFLDVSGVSNAVAVGFSANSLLIPIVDRYIYLIVPTHSPFDVSLQLFSACVCFY